MARSSIISNGRVCVGLDEKGFVHDFYYPHVGLHNMTSARFIHHKIGISIDDEFSWLDDAAWDAESGYDEHNLIVRTHYHHKTSGISISTRDFVDHELDFFGRVVIVNNSSNSDKNIKIFFAQVFRISNAGRSDTALYVPSKAPYLLTYYRNTAFVTGLRTQDLGSFDQFAVGNYGIEGKSGTYVDAEDGQLSGNLVEHAGVDSCIRSSFIVKAKHAYHLDYWNAASDKGYSAASNIHRNLQSNGLYHYLNATIQSNRTWLAKSDQFINKLDVKYQKLAKISLAVIKYHQDILGGVLASADSSIYNYGRDYYSYVWPRDSYFALQPLLKLGYTEEVKSYLKFASENLHPRGYTHHKYSPDGAIGSSWHPMMQDGKPELNIQEDETASLVLIACDYLRTDKAAKDRWIYEKIIIKCTNFLASYIDPEIDLPHPSYDLWEQLFLTTTYSTACVYKSLIEAAKLAREYGDIEYADKWDNIANKIYENKSRLFSEKNQYFVRGLKNAFNNFAQDNTLDISSLYGVINYNLCEPDDTSVYATLKAVESELLVAGGVIRYPGDNYMLTSNAKGNPWFVCTLWLAEIYWKSNVKDKTLQLLDWVLNNQTNSGMLSEQVDPTTLEVRGVAPLVWSHAQYLSTLILITQSDS